MDFQTVGRELFLRGLVSSHGGNLSVREGEKLRITRHGAKLGLLTNADLVETGLTGNDEAVKIASTELEVHRAIYLATSARAIVHTHPPHVVALSFDRSEIVFLDMEGVYYLPVVPVIGRELVMKHGAFASEIAEGLINSKAVVVYGHGSFVAGQTLEEAYQLTTTLEQSCHILWLAQHPRMQIDPRMARKSKKGLV